MSEDPDGPDVAPFKRRRFLASAALAAGAPATVAGPAQAAALPAGGPLAAPSLGSVARLLAVPETNRGVGWIRSALQVAVALELAAIPPYLCGWWSVRDRGSEVARMIRRIVADEMYHMGIVCNLLVAVGGRPRIKAAAPVYPGPLPGGVRAGLTVYLSGLSRSFVRDVMMAIEAPEEPLTRSAPGSPTVGRFYGDLLNAFRAVQPELSVAGQLSQHIGSDDLHPVETLDDVERAIEIIREQGEGTASSPAESFYDDHPAHYYAFGEIYHGRELRETDDGWRYVGAPVPFPDVRPMAPVPAGGWPSPPTHVQQLLFRFDATYSTVLDRLDAAWAGGGPRSLHTAVHAMHALERPAVELMEIGLSYAPGNYGPQFRALRRPRRSS
ncbi:ferritin-like protein [Streptomyces sp. ISL-22]|uniref:ferritin-like domain-containing protein n=1 Tax=unclassified Streptomyces TaxID=2593676 RepID=UPI001BEC6CDF|nr:MULTISPECIES: ferritin-like protein [unclassified Streptomyces]MBT2419313.1 ferritin-like protein [Streptomyces sp. ISL-24]MBT2436809.1 ferritin-like protein [Streptomyces sp. ISL-22]